MLVIDDSRIIDAEHPLRPELGELPQHCDYLAGGRVVLMASPERHINLSCEPNTFIRWIGGERHVIARRTLESGEEITYDYLIDCDGGQPWECPCGSTKCLQFIPASVFDLALYALCQRLPYLSEWFVAEHRSRIEETRRRCEHLIDSPQGELS